MTTDNTETIYFKKGYAKFDKNKADYHSATETYKYTFSLQKAHAIILHPSFCCPLVIEPSNPIILYLLINKELQENYFFKQKEEPKASRLYIERLNAQLRYSLWENRLKYGNRFKHPENGTLFFEYAKENPELDMISTEPKWVDPKTDLILLDEKNYIAGIVNAEILKLYAENGFKHFVRLIIHNHKLTDGLYNIHWTSINTDPEETKKCNPIAPAFIPQDLLLEKALENYRTKIKTTFHIPFDSADTYPLELHADDPIESFHPVLVTTKEKLGLGHLTDVHLSSRQHIFKKSTLQVIPGASKTVSPPLGELVHASFDSLKDLMDQMGKATGVDMLFFTGDLIDFSLNLDPSLAKVNCSEDIWKLMMLQSNHTKKSSSGICTNTVNPKTQLEQTHTPGVDDTMIYSLFKYFYDTYKKPIFLTSGNHDSYGLPFGISPRILNFKANEGIPMDHNLTFYEAILLFGKGYKDIIKSFNFEPKHSRWLYHVFTPMKDFSFQYKKQVFTGLEWGNDEVFITNINEETFGGRLPRANTMLNKNQIKILEDSQNRSQSKGLNILFTHATIVNYETKTPLKERGKVFFNTGIKPGFSQYDYGSFYQNRKKFYTDYIVNNKLTHTFSGHSHRSALYTCMGMGLMPKESVDGGLLKWEFMETTACSLTPRKNSYGSLLLSGCTKTKIIVTGSGGPLPTENIIGELGGLGLGIPTGTMVTFNGTKEYISAIHAKNKTAKPRFAVALDAFEIIGGHLIFTQFDCFSLDKPIFHVTLNKKLPPIASMIKSIGLHFFDDELGKYVHYPMSLNPKPYISTTMEVIPQNMTMLTACLNVIIKSKSDPFGFMSINFSDKLSHNDLFCQYNFDSPLIICIQIHFPLLFPVKVKCSITRSSKFGEIPNFELYKR